MSRDKDELPYAIRPLLPPTGQVFKLKSPNQLNLEKAKQRELLYGLNKSKHYQKHGLPLIDDEHCRMCETNAQMVILKDELWDKGDMVLCFDCIENHVLKRAISISDLKPNVPANLAYFRGYMMR